MDTHAFAHLPFFTLQPPDEFVRKLKSQGAYVITTISIIDVVGMRHNLSRLSEPHIKLTVPPMELETVKKEEAWDQYLTTMVRSIYPSMPEWFAMRYLSHIFRHHGPVGS
jgi:hypothetical protein